MKVSFDYDKTFTKPEVREFALELRERGYEVYILTYRYDNANFDKYQGKYTPYYNADLWEDLEECGLHRNVVFTNHQPKSVWLNFTEGILFHIDDDKTVMFDLTHNSKVIPIQTNSPKWRQKIERILKDIKKEEKQCCGNWDEFGVCKCSNFVNNEK